MFATAGTIMRGIEYALGTLNADGWKRFPMVGEAFPGGNADYHHKSWAVTPGQSMRIDGDRYSRAQIGLHCDTEFVVSWSWRVRAQSPHSDRADALDAEQHLLAALATQFPTPLVPATADPAGPMMGGGRLHFAAFEREAVPIVDEGGQAVAIVFVGRINLRFTHHYEWAPPGP